MYKEYQTKRLILKTLSIVDAKITVDYYEKNRQFLDQWFPAREEVFYSQDYQENMLANQQIELINGKGINLWIFEKDHHYNTIGAIHFSDIIRGRFLSCFLSFHLDEDKFNQGYAREALTQGVKVIFREYQLHRIEANIRPDNKRAINLLESVGFYSEGIAKKHIYIDGIWQDHVRMVLLNRSMEVLDLKLDGLS